MKYHTPVLLTESIEALNIKTDGYYIDCTLGEAGHSLEILKRITESGVLLSIDQDQQAIDFVMQTYPEKIGSNWIIKQGNFSKIAELNRPINRKPNGILMDIGISSRQIDIKGRGFSYRNENDPLDMRMDLNLGVKASDLLNFLNERQLTKLFWEYGEEKFATRISKIIKQNKVKTVGDLTSLIYKVVPATSRENNHHHPARRVFQALRIAVNDELGSLKKGLEEGYELLDKNGRLVVITFHSLEDRIVKQFMKSKKDGEIIIDGITPSEQEIKINSRSHSARLRVIEKH